jgi:hypothetical protein
VEFIGSSRRNDVTAGAGEEKECCLLT